MGRRGQAGKANFEKLEVQFFFGKPNFKFFEIGLVHLHKSLLSKERLVRSRRFNVLSTLYLWHFELHSLRSSSFKIFYSKPVFYPISST